MDYIKVFFGLALAVTFIWLLARNWKRSGIMHALFRLDTVVGIVAGLYLVFTGLHSLLMS